MAEFFPGLERVRGLLRTDDRLGEAVFLISRASGRARPLEFLGATASAIAALPGPAAERGKAITGLLDTRATRRAFRRLTSGERREVRRALDFPHPRAGIAPETAWLRFRSTFLNWRREDLQTSLWAIRRAHGVGYALLAAEQTFRKQPEGDLEQAAKVLGRIEIEFLRYWAARPEKTREERLRVCHELTFTEDAIGVLRGARKREAKKKYKIDEFFKIAVLIDYLASLEARRPRRSSSKPLLLGDYLLGRDVEYKGGGACHPRVTLAAHLGDLIGIPFEILFHTRHVNLYHGPSHIVFDPSFTPPFFSTLGYWEDLGSLGEHQGPVTLEALMAGTLLNLWAVSNRGFLAKSDRLIEAALRVYPEYPQAFFLRAFATGEPRERIRLLHEALRGHPRFAAAEELLAQTYDDLGKTRPASHHYERALRASRANLIAGVRAMGENSPYAPEPGAGRRLRRRLGHLHVQAGRIGDAVRLLRETLRIQPTDMEATLDLASHLSDMERGREEAKRLYRKVARESPNLVYRAQAHFSLGWMAWNDGNRRQAFHCWDQSIRNDPKTIEALRVGLREALDRFPSRQVAAFKQAAAEVRRFFEGRIS